MFSTVLGNAVDRFISATSSAPRRRPTSFTVSAQSMFRDLMRDVIDLVASVVASEYLLAFTDYGPVCCLQFNRSTLPSLFPVVFSGHPRPTAINLSRISAKCGFTWTASATARLLLSSSSRTMLSPLERAPPLLAVSVLPQDSILVTRLACRPHAIFLVTHSTVNYTTVVSCPSLIRTPSRPD